MTCDYLPEGKPKLSDDDIRVLDHLFRNREDDEYKGIFDTDEERKFWLDLHKEELDKEEKEAFEKQVEEQKDLRDFVEVLKKKDLEKAEQEIKKANDDAERSNEYHKFIEDRQKAGKPLPAGETLKKDAEALKKAAEAPAPGDQPVDPAAATK